MPTAVRQLTELPKSAQKRVTDKIDFFTAQKDPLAFAKQLIGYRGYRFRIGDYRVIFQIVSGTLFVLMVVQRDKAYRDL